MLRYVNYLAAGLILLPMSLVHAQQQRRATLGDYIAAQRAVISAEVAKVDEQAQAQRVAAFIASTPPAPDKNKKALDFPAYVPPPEPKPILLGIMSLDRIVAEVSHLGRTQQLAVGQVVGATAWRIVSISRTTVTMSRPPLPQAPSVPVPPMSSTRKATPMAAAHEVLTLSLAGAN